MEIRRKRGQNVFFQNNSHGNRRPATATTGQPSIDVVGVIIRLGIGPHIMVGQSGSCMAENGYDLMGYGRGFPENMERVICGKSS